jgi:hypothetical protein
VKSNIDSVEVHPQLRGIQWMVHGWVLVHCGWKLSVLSYYEHFFPHESCQTLSPDVPLKIWDDYLSDERP